MSRRGGFCLFWVLGIGVLVALGATGCDFFAPNRTTIYHKQPQEPLGHEGPDAEPGEGLVRPTPVPAAPMVGQSPTPTPAPLPTAPIAPPEPAPLPDLTPAVPVPECGDGRLDSGEECDDGNKLGGEGCSENCTVEPGWWCPEPGMPCLETFSYCGDGRVTPPEICDDGNTQDGDGCSEQCFREAGYVCPVPGEPCIWIVLCGDGVIGGAGLSEGSEQCDDGNQVDGDGCSSSCRAEAGWVCGNAGMRCAPACDEGALIDQEEPAGGVPDSGVPDSGVPDGGVSEGVVPDGGVLSGFFEAAGCDVCDYTCLWGPYCGDGIIQGNEECDNGVNRDRYLSTPEACAPGCVLPAYCGDGILQPLYNERCDFGTEGNTGEYDGCNTDCTLGPRCGDGIVHTTNPEYCVNGMTVPDSLRLPTGYRMPYSRPCLLFPPGALERDEQCDDGNQHPHDECSQLCTVERIITVP